MATTTITLRNTGNDDGPPSIGGLYFILLFFKIIRHKQRLPPRGLLIQRPHEQTQAGMRTKGPKQLT